MEVGVVSGGVGDATDHLVFWCRNRCGLWVMSKFHKR